MYKEVPAIVHNLKSIIIQIIIPITDKLSAIQMLGLIKWLLLWLNNGLFAHYPNGGLKNRLLHYRTHAHELNTGLVGFSDPGCTCLFSDNDEVDSGVLGLDSGQGLDCHHVSVQVQLKLK